jgi:hypothetical protein
VINCHDKIFDPAVLAELEVRLDMTEPAMRKWNSSTLFREASKLLSGENSLGNPTLEAYRRRLGTVSSTSTREYIGIFILACKDIAPGKLPFTELVRLFVDLFPRHEERPRLMDALGGERTLVDSTKTFLGKMDLWLSAETWASPAALAGSAFAASATSEDGPRKPRPSVKAKYCYFHGYLGHLGNECRELVDRDGKSFAKERAAKAPTDEGGSKRTYEHRRS